MLLLMPFPGLLPPPRHLLLLSFHLFQPPLCLPFLLSNSLNNRPPVCRLSSCSIPPLFSMPSTRCWVFLFMVMSPLATSVLLFLNLSATLFSITFMIWLILVIVPLTA